MSETSQRARAAGSSERACRGEGEPVLTVTSVPALPASPGAPEIGLLRPGPPPSLPKGVTQIVFLSISPGASSPVTPNSRSRDGMKPDLPVR